MVQISFKLALVVSALAASTSFAFVPHHQGSAAIGSSSFVPRHVAVVPSSATSTALSMNLFDRFSRVAKSNLNNILKNWEDPEKIMNQAIIDMQNDLGKIRESYAQVTASQRRLLKRKQQADALANDWYNRAQLALKRSNEGLAREALARREVELENAKNFQQQLDSQASSLDKLYEGMQVLEEKILQSKGKKDEMIARARTAKSTKQVNDMLAGLNDKIQVLGGLLSVSSTQAFAAMEEKVEAMEAAAEASAEMGIMGLKSLPGGSKTQFSLENEFKSLEQSDAVDKELQKMKGLLSGSSDTTVSNKSYANFSPTYYGSSF